MIFPYLLHIQYYFHTHPEHSLTQALVHFLDNEIAQAALFSSAIFALILLTRIIIKRWRVKKTQ